LFVCFFFLFCSHARAGYDIAQGFISFSINQRALKEKERNKKKSGEGT